MIFNNKNKVEEDFEFPDDKTRWAALLRGQVLTATTQKYFNFINLADQKSQAMIILNSVLIPFILTWVGKPGFGFAATISLIAAIASIFAAIISIYPRRRAGVKPDGTRNLLHFSDVSQLTEDEFLNEFLPVYNDASQLSEVAIKDLHDMARRIIKPKYFWLKISYGVFFIGNLIAVAFALFALWTDGVH